MPGFPFNIASGGNPGLRCCEAFVGLNVHPTDGSDPGPAPGPSGLVPTDRRWRPGLRQSAAALGVAIISLQRASDVLRTSTTRADITGNISNTESRIENGSVNYSSDSY